MNSVWSSVHWSLADSPCWFRGRNVWTHSTLSRSVSCHGVVASGQVLSVLAWICWVIWETHNEGVFLFFFILLGLMRCFGMGGGEEKVRFWWSSSGTLVMMGLSSSLERQSASVSSLYS